MAQTIKLPIPSIAYTLVMTIVIMIANLRGVDMFAKIQDLVAFLLVGSMIIMGLIGMFKLGTGQVVSQPYAMATKPSELFFCYGYSILAVYRGGVCDSGFQEC